MRLVGALDAYGRGRKRNTAVEPAGDLSPEGLPPLLPAVGAGPPPYPLPPLEEFVLDHKT